MHTRKVVKHGSSSLSINLPRKWVQINDVKKGDDLQIYEEGSSLIIGEKKRTEEFSVSRKVSIPKTIPKKAMMHYVASLYRFGLDKVEFKYEKGDTYKAIKKSIGDLTGWEVVKNTKSCCEIETSLEIDQSRLKGNLEKLMHNVSHFAKEGCKAIEKKNLTDIEHLQNNEDIINGLANFCERILIKKGCGNPFKTPFLFYMIKELENIADEYFRICTYFLSTKKISDKTMFFYKKTNNLFEKFKKIYFEEKAEKHLRIENGSLLHEEMGITFEEVYKLLQANNKHDCILHHLLSILRRLKSSLGCLFSIMIVEEEK